MPRIINTKRVVVEVFSSPDKTWGYTIEDLEHNIRIGVVSSGDKSTGVTAFVFGRWLLRVGVIKKVTKKPS